MGGERRELIIALTIRIHSSGLTRSCNMWVSQQVPHVVAPAVLALLYSIVYFWQVPSLGLTRDDWLELHHGMGYSLGALAGTWPLDYRPFEALPWVALAHIAGPTLGWYYVALFMVSYVTAVALYVLLRSLTGSVIQALCASLLWAVYPADMAQYWPAAFAYRLGALFCVLAAVCLVIERRAAHPRRWYGAAILTTALCLASQELYLGLLLLVAGLAAFGVCTYSYRQRLLRAVPFLVLISCYLGYRLWIGPHVLHLIDVKTGSYAFNMGHIVGVIIGAFRATIINAWLVAVLTAAQSITGTGGMIDVVLLDLISGLGVAMVGVILMHIARLLFRRKTRPEGQFPGRALAIGALVLMCGYAALIPTSLLPTVVGIDTRLNTAADLGGALFVSGLVWVAAHIIPLPRLAARGLILGVTLCLVSIGAIRQEQSAHAFVTTWTAERAFWRDMFRIAPGLVPHTFVEIIAQDDAASKALAGFPSWWTDDALALLYPRATIRGATLTMAQVPLACGPRTAKELFVSPGLAHVTPTGVSLALGAIVPARRVLVVRYWGAGRTHAAVVTGTLYLGEPRCMITSHSTLVRRESTPPVAVWRALIY